ncbi:response regulator [Jiangella mangrovi]|uniref:DNA-binding NarL/FixJ family response regulator n=1 Tax=Jiangella mangrovi TaxID=1524084 RepID=A0A7W9GU22_9ACTN|nr:DNA-binding NarL/FixJ family response regulator [Jiangella mangrovi]
MSTRVLIADDQEAIRSAFRMVVDAQPDMHVVAEAADGDQALRLARELRPDVVLADIRMPGIDGLELTRRLAGPGVPDPLRVVVVTTFDLDTYVHAALAGGACGFLLKRSGPTLLVEAVRAAVAGDTLISPQVTVRLLRHLRRPTPSAVADDVLTDREREVARLVARGLSNAEIAAELFISAGTAKNHLANIQQKLGVRNRVAVAGWAWASGLVTADGDT